MIVYYVSDVEKPKNAIEVKFYMDASSARDASFGTSGSVYQFEVNDKCDSQVFGMDTILLFNKDPDTSELKFLASGQWVELHEIMNIPFYKDFESHSNRFVSMSLKYFNDHYLIKERAQDNHIKAKKESSIKPKADVKDAVNEPSEDAGGIDTDVLSELFGL